MKLSYNFISLVAIGNFNPAIASSDFLTRVCELNLGELKNESPPFVPVHKELTFESLVFIIDLNILQIRQNGIEDIYKSEILKIFNTYQQKLPYTPLTAVGVNINCNLVPEKANKIDSLVEKMSSPKTYIDFLQANEVDVRENSLQTKTDRTWVSSTYHIMNVSNLHRHITLGRERDFFTLNYNYEARKLDQNLSQLQLTLLIDQYKQFCGEFLEFIKYLED